MRCILSSRVGQSAGLAADGTHSDHTWQRRPRDPEERKLTIDQARDSVQRARTHGLALPKDDALLGGPALTGVVGRAVGAGKKPGDPTSRPRWPVKVESKDYDTLASAEAEEANPQLTAAKRWALKVRTVMATTSGQPATGGSRKAAKGAGMLMTEEAAKALLERIDALETLLPQEEAFEAHRKRVEAEIPEVSESSDFTLAIEAGIELSKTLWKVHRPVLTDAQEQAAKAVATTPAERAPGQKSTRAAAEGQQTHTGTPSAKLTPSRVKAIKEEFKKRMNLPPMTPVWVLPGGVPTTMPRERVRRDRAKCSTTCRRWRRGMGWAAQQRRQGGCACRSINWGAWACQTQSAGRDGHRPRQSRLRGSPKPRVCVPVVARQLRAVVAAGDRLARHRSTLDDAAAADVAL